MSPISAAVNVIAVEEETQSKQSVSTQSTATESITPNQPLPGSSVNLNALWRMVEEQFKEVANALSGTGKEHSDAKKALLDAVRDSQINQLKERESKIAEQQKAAKKSNFWSKLGMALGVLAALIVAPFNPVMAAVMIVTIVAAEVIPKVADKVMKAAGVPEDIRNKVKMGLEIGIGIVGMLLSFNPMQLIKNAAQIALTAPAKLAAACSRAADSIKALKTLISSLISIVTKSGPSLGKSGVSLSKARQLLDSALNTLKAAASNAAKMTKQALQESLETAKQMMKEVADIIKEFKETAATILESLKSTGTVLKEVLSNIAKSTFSILDDISSTLKNLNPIEMVKELSGQMKNVINSIKPMLKQPSQLLNKVKQMLDDVFESFKDLLTNSEKARLRATRASQVMEVSSSTSSVVSAGYGVKSADIAKDLEIDEARQKELEARIQQILMMLDQALRSLNEVFQSIF
ncbi:hypothetical protein C1141_17695, partial [Vibrio agarivorans]